ncbi:MAG TPA: class I SAM-dependent methyltransferase [Nocardioidaceae bacterium]|jgi:SAM-dependent methyltransferase
MNTPARYDGSAQWYDERFRHYGDLTEVDSSASLLATVLGRGDGWCLDVGCGTGLHAAAIESTGRRVFGVDLSADQLAHAAHRIAVRVRTDATRLPFRDGTFPSAVCTYVHTDIEQIGQVFAEVCRVMRHGGTFVYVGVHPCFWGPHIERVDETTRVVHPGYWECSWRTRSPYWSDVGLASRVGFRHRTLADLLTELLSSGLRLTHVAEGARGAPFADRIAIAAVKE